MTGSKVVAMEIFWCSQIIPGRWLLFPTGRRRLQELEEQVLAEVREGETMKGTEKSVTSTKMGDILCRKRSSGVDETG